MIPKLPFTVWPPESVTEQETVVDPTGKRAPDAGLQVGVKAPSSLSFAVAEYVTCAPAGSVVCTSATAGRLNDGG